MHDIQLVHEGEDYITIGYKDEENNYMECDITNGIAIEVIKVMGTALYKDSFIKKMKTYRIKFTWMGPYPKEAVMSKDATSMATAANRAIKEWKKTQGKGVKDITIKIITI